jgi:predicted TIM-barrel fold metal-dependent hydrolase
MNKWIRRTCHCQIGILACLLSCSTPVKYYSADDFEKVPKIDAHLHYLTTSGRFIEFATTQLFSMVSPNVDNEVPIEVQWDISRTILQKYPRGIAFLVTFEADNFASPGFSAGVISRIEESVRQGASGVKIWKNIGMEIRDSAGRYVLADNPAFAPIFKYLAEKKIPLLAHLGEPRDCWLPEEEMTDYGDKMYYKNHPEYHMFLHPEMPSYDEQIRARDHLLELHPDLIFVGAHLGSLEWNIDELALRFDRYPNFAVDMAARIGHLQNQSRENREHVREFMIKYQDRILYATDTEVYDAVMVDFELAAQNIRNGWRNDWIYLATDSTLRGVTGLKLPVGVINKIYHDNTERYYHLKSAR